MLLAVDIGNTNIVFGLFSGEILEGSFRMMTREQRTSDEVGLLVCQYMRQQGLGPPDIQAVVMASVVPQVTPTLSRALGDYLGCQPLIVDEDIFPALLYEGEERLGADRAVACDAALALYGGPLILLDFGTATTVDAVSHEGRYLGGCILAGPGTALEALSAKAAALPLVPLCHPGAVLGVTAITQIQAGALVGYLGAVERLIRDARQEMGYGDGVKVVATGGLAPLIAAHTDQIDVVDGELVLTGLRMLYKKDPGPGHSEKTR